MASPDYVNAKQLAENILKEAEVKSPPIQIIDIAISQGLKVKFVKLPEKLDEISGIFDKESKTIYVNSDDPPRRQAFTIAHELGHFILKHSVNEYGFLPRGADLLSTSTLEKEANYFAANLLIPKEMVENIIKQNDLDKALDINILAGLFGVSREFMKYRLDGLNGRARHAFYKESIRPS